MEPTPPEPGPATGSPHELIVEGREELLYMRRPSSAKTASIGVTQTRLAVETTLSWLFREQPTEDYGIDGHRRALRSTRNRLRRAVRRGAVWPPVERPSSCLAVR